MEFTDSVSHAALSLLSELSNNSISSLSDLNANNRPANVLSIVIPSLSTINRSASTDLPGAYEALGRFVRPQSAASLEPSPSSPSLEASLQLLACVAATNPSAWSLALRHAGPRGLSERLDKAETAAQVATEETRGLRALLSASEAKNAELCERLRKDLAAREAGEAQLLELLEAAQQASGSLARFQGSEARPGLKEVEAEMRLSSLQALADSNEAAARGAEARARGFEAELLEVEARTAKALEMLREENRALLQSNEMLEARILSVKPIEIKAEALAARNFELAHSVQSLESQLLEAANKNRILEKRIRMAEELASEFRALAEVPGALRPLEDFEPSTSQTRDSTRKNATLLPAEIENLSRSSSLLAPSEEQTSSSRPFKTRKSCEKVFGSLLQSSGADSEDKSKHFPLLYSALSSYARDFFAEQQRYLTPSLHQRGDKFFKQFSLDHIIGTANH